MGISPPLRVNRTPKLVRVVFISVSLRAEFEARTCGQVVYLGGVVDAGCTIRSPLRNERLIRYLLGALWLRALGCQGCPSYPNTGWPQLPRATQLKVTLISGSTYIQRLMKDGAQRSNSFPHLRLSLKLEASSQLQNSEDQCRVTWCFFPLSFPPWVVLIPRTLHSEPDPCL